MGTSIQPEPADLPVIAEQSARASMPMLPGLDDITPEQEAGIVAARDTLGDYSGARIAERQPRLYALVAGMIAEGLRDAGISRVTGLSRATVSSIRRREMDSMPTRAYMAAQARNLRLAATLATDELRERLEDPARAAEMSARDLAYSIQILQAHAQLLAGEPTERVAELRSAGADASLRALLAGRVVEAAPAMDSRAEIVPSREGRCADLDGHASGGDAASDEAQRDAQSPTSEA